MSDPDTVLYKSQAEINLSFHAIYRSFSLLNDLSAIEERITEIVEVSIAASLL